MEWNSHVRVTGSSQNCLHLNKIKARKNITVHLVVQHTLVGSLTSGDINLRLGM